MKLRIAELVKTIAILSVCVTTNSVATGASPASVEYVNQAIAAATTLTQADWQAVCQSGNINSTGGCYGDAGSQAFSKVNLFTGNALGYAGVTGSAANSVWLRQVGTGTSCTATNQQLGIRNTSGTANSTIWICGVQLTNGASVSLAAGLGAPVDDVAYGPEDYTAGIPFTTIASGNMVGGGHTPLTPNQLYFADSAILPTAYVFCISTTNTSVATAFAQTPGVNFNGGPAC